MRVWHKTAAGWREAHGPADIAGAQGVVRIEGSVNDREVARWAFALGVFVARGGDIRRLDHAANTQS